MLSVRPTRWCYFSIVCSGLALFSAESLAQTEPQKIFTQQPEVAPFRVNDGEVVVPKKEKPAAAKKNLTQGGPVPKWIWGSASPGASDRFFLRKEFSAESKFAELMASCDNQMTIWINGKRVASGGDWNSPAKISVQKFLKPGKNELLAEVTNAGGPAGFVLKLGLESSDGKRNYVVSDKSWQAATKKDSQQWAPASELAKLGASPWGNVFDKTANTLNSGAPRDVFSLLPGFQVERLYTVPKNEQGSWVCIAPDNKGRLIASDQGNKGLYRITPPALGSDESTRVEKLDVKMSGAQGMVYAFGSLYVSANGGPGSGLYRLRDTNGDDQFDEVKKLKAFQGGGEHGPHAVRLSPDKKSLYVIAGNHTNPPADFNASRVPSNWGEDLLLPRQWDARGHARGKLAPGGWIAKTDPEGKTWEMISTGYRNPYDMDFNADGELFAYDADMEWDMGTPWYRPTRVGHAVSGSDFGWRSGTGKWPTYYIDSLPEVVNIGPGSPVGVTFGTGAKFPAKYQRALYLLDWTFGTIHAIHLTPQGSSYVGVEEEFVSRIPLPLTDAAVGSDGAFYFTVGGRGAQSELFRVTYQGKESTSPVSGGDQRGADLRAIRRSLEALHHRADAKVVDTAWPYLAHEDRHIQYAARVAIEHQDVSHWQQRALEESNPRASIVALVALARQGKKERQQQVLAALERIDFGKLEHFDQLSLLRAYALTFVRLGGPDQLTASRIAKRLDPFYPAKSVDLNRELCRLLAYLNSPTVIDKTLALMNTDEEQDRENINELLARNSRYGGSIAKMLANHPDVQKIHYAFALRTMKYGWTLDQRKKYFDWFTEAGKKSGGASYQGFINNIRTEALENVTPQERAALEAKSPPAVVKVEQLPKPQGPGKKWTVADLVSLTSSGLSGRGFENGKKMFAAAQCASCHRFLGTGGSQAHDLTNLAGRFSIKDLGESIIEPSKVISDQYRASIIETTGGKIISGRIVGEEEGKLVVQTNALDPSKITKVAKTDVESSTPSPISMMPKELLNTMNQEEVLDLIAYLLSRGNAEDRMFAK